MKTIHSGTDNSDLKDKIDLVYLFPELSADHITNILNKSFVRSYTAGMAICNEGEYGDTCFAIIEGSVEVSIKTEGYDNLPLSVLDEGNIFGEMAALSGNPRNATVTAKDDTTVLEIPADVLKDIIASSPSFKQNLDALYTERAVRTHLRKVPFFAHFDEREIMQLEAMASMVTYNQGDKIFSEGEAGDSLYILRTGFVRVTKKFDGRDEVIAYIAHGNYFGEMALIENESRSATVSAFTKTEMIRISMNDFKILLDADPDLSGRIKSTAQERRLQNLRVRKDRSRALKLENIGEKGIIQAHSLLIIDLKSCIHCDNCVEACEDRHGYPRLDRRGIRIAEISVPVACRLCQDPLCLVCDFDAIKRAPSGEIYVIDEKCIGVSGCAIRCPYNVIRMVPTVQDSGRKWYDVMGRLLRERKEEADEAGVRKIKSKRLAIKCDNCMGYGDTACTNNCPTHAIKWVNPMDYFGDKSDFMLKKS